MSLRDNKVDSLTTRLIDFHQRRVVNAASAVDPNDYVIKQDLDNAIAGVKNVAGPSISSSSTTNITGTVVVDHRVLTANLTINTAIVTPPPNNTKLALILVQDGTGGWITTFGTDFQTFPSNLGVLANKTTVIEFVAYGGKWYQSSEPISNR